jgi:hypothetical protein
MLSSQAEEDNITRYLLEIFWEIVTGIGEILKIDCMELFEEIIRDTKKAEEVMTLFSSLATRGLLQPTDSTQPSSPSIRMEAPPFFTLIVT